MDKIEQAQIHVAEHFALATGELLRLYFASRIDAHPNRCAFIDEAIRDGTGKVAISIVPHTPMTIELVFMNDQGGHEILMTLTADRVGGAFGSALN